MIKPLMFLNIAFLIALYWIGYIYQAFLLNIVIAALLSLATSGTNSKVAYQIDIIYRKLFKRPCSMVSLLASTVMTLVLMSILFVPLIYFIYKIASIVNSTDISAIIIHLKSTILVWLHSAEWIPISVQNQILEYTSLAKEQDYLSNMMVLAKDLGSEVMRFIMNSALILVFYFFANLYGSEILIFIRNLLPLSASGTNLIFNQISQTMSVVMYSTIFIAILEGIIFAIGALWLGYDPFFWGIAYAFSSLIPIIGGAIIWVPMAMYELSLGNIDNAIFIALYTIIVNAIIADTFLKPIIIEFINRKFSKRNQIDKSSSNSLIIFFAIIAGMSVYGFWGIILGPAATSLFISLLLIYDKLAKTEAAKSNSSDNTI